MRSSSRPGVATTMAAPLRSACTWSRLGTPPYTHTVLQEGAEGECQGISMEIQVSGRRHDAVHAHHGAASQRKGPQCVSGGPAHWRFVRSWCGAPSMCHHPSCPVGSCPPFRFCGCLAAPAKSLASSHPATAPDAALAARLFKHRANLQRQLARGSNHQRHRLLACMQGRDAGWSAQSGLQQGAQHHMARQQRSACTRTSMHPHA